MPVEASKFRRAVIENTLRSCQLFVGLSISDIEAIASFIIPKHLAKDEDLFRQGEDVHGFYIVQRGAINVHCVSPSGKEQVIHLFRPVESFAEAALASKDGYLANARATEETTVLLVPKSDFMELLRLRPELSLRLLGSMSQHLRVLIGLVDDLTLKDIETRVTNWLLQRCPRPILNRETEIRLDGTKRMLAAELGTTSETLSRTLAKLRDAKLLRITGNRLTVTRPIELQKLLQRHLGA
jgi:CRP-like cAMP-binding protein